MNKKARHPVEKEHLSSIDRRNPHRAKLPTDVKRRKDRIKIRRTGTVTKKRNAEVEKALCESVELYRTLFDYAKDGIALVDVETGRLVECNQALCGMVGRDKTELVGQMQTILHPPQVVAKGLSASFVLHQSGDPGMITEEQIISKTGELMTVEIRAARVLVKDRDCLLGVFRDITGRKRAEAEIIRQRDEISHITRVATMGELASSLAHEINQPLTAILSNAQAALRLLTADKPDLEEVVEALKDIVNDDQRAGKVIKELRELMRRTEPSRELLDMRQVIEEVLVLMKSDLLIRNINIIGELSADLPPVLSSRVQLQQVLINLINNGYEAMKDTVPAEKMLTIRAFAGDPKNITVEIADRGHGFLKESMVDKIFEPFFTTKQKGLGMGLPIVKSIIEAHGGTMSARSNADKGATISFMLPAGGKQS